MNAFETYLRNAEEMAGRAIAAREKIFQGNREARAKAEADGTDPLTAVLTWEGHTQYKSLMGDHRWYMEQAAMYSHLAQLRASAFQMAEAKKQTVLLENIDRQLDLIHNSMKEMKVY